MVEIKETLSGDRKWNSEPAGGGFNSLYLQYPCNLLSAHCLTDTKYQPRFFSPSLMCISSPNKGGSVKNSTRAIFKGKVMK
jgi:hypothetical protein